VPERDRTYLNFSRRGGMMMIHSSEWLDNATGADTLVEMGMMMIPQSAFDRGLGIRSITLQDKT
jgi:hypothetical protein